VTKHKLPRGKPSFYSKISKIINLGEKNTHKKKKTHTHLNLNKTAKLFSSKESWAHSLNHCSSAQ